MIRSSFLSTSFLSPSSTATYSCCSSSLLILLHRIILSPPLSSFTSPPSRSPNFHLHTLTNRAISVSVVRSHDPIWYRRPEAMSVSGGLTHTDQEENGKKGEGEGRTLLGHVNSYKSFEVDLLAQPDYRPESAETETETEFEEAEQKKKKKQLKEDLTQCEISCKQNGICSLWLKIDKRLSWAIPVAVQAGYDFHHAKSAHKADSYVMMTKWFDETRDNALPVYAHHFAGVGGLVTNEKGEILAIREKFAGDPDSNMSKFWKLPGGHVDPGEDLGEAVEREVFEETGIRAHFKSVLAFRHMHNYRFGCSDFYFCCLMTADTSSPHQQINASQHEVLECRWFSVQEYLDTKPTALLAFFLDQYKKYLNSSSGSVIDVTRIENVRRKHKDTIYFCSPPATTSTSSNNTPNTPSILS